MVSKVAFGAATAAGLAIAASAVAAPPWSEWSAPVSAEDGGSHPSLNTPFVEGCPNLSPDGLSLYFASNRDNYVGQKRGLPRNLDIWVARRSSTSDGWGAPVNLGEPINSPGHDFCPTPVRGKRLFFASDRKRAGDSDIFVSRQSNDGSWEGPTDLGPNINSPAAEFSPSYFEDEAGDAILYFSSGRAGGLGKQDIYQSVNFGPAELAPGALNSPADDARPNVSRDGREIVFDSTRVANGIGPDIWTARRESTRDPWPAPEPITQVNSNRLDTRPALSWDGTQLVFGSNRAGGEGPLTTSDLYVSTRTKNRGKGDGKPDELRFRQVP